MTCPCCGREKVWKTDRSTRRGGVWACPLVRARSNSGKERQLRYWHKSDGGYIRRRRRDLADQRQRALRELDLLEKEIQALESQP